ncbi:hypothetical protein J2S70_000043 [Trueperella bonasi]|uniref:Uncharacterized protein n=1 Tax=Trueperella bonasi TaxID=312286 RepID=A0ABT9NDJ3_9ACTO|nr:hypothetical protein [Trueperella bonasi]
MWLWVLLFGLVGLGIYLGVTLREIWNSLKGLGVEAGRFSAAIREVTIPASEPHRSVESVYDDPARIKDARADRRRISEVRARARRRRFNHATQRWESTTDGSFSAISRAERDRARQRMKEA